MFVAVRYDASSPATHAITRAISSAVSAPIPRDAPVTSATGRTLMAAILRPGFLALQSLIFPTLKAIAYRS